LPRRPDPAASAPTAPEPRPPEAILGPSRCPQLPNPTSPRSPKPSEDHRRLFADSGQTTDPAGFTGRTLGDPAVWQQTAAFEENFPTLASRGKFLDTYKFWSAYPENYLTTDKKGFYDPDIAIVDVDGTRAMELRVVSGKTNGTGKPSGASQGLGKVALSKR
jgi:hypothetical protein